MHSKKFIIKHKQNLRDNIINISVVIVTHIERLKPALGLQKCLNMPQVDYSTYLRWRQKKSCMASLFNICIFKHPTQLLKTEADAIKEYNENPAYSLWPKVSIYHQMRRDGMLNCCRNTYYKVINALGLKKAKPACRRKKHEKGIEADAPLKLIHIDVTQLKCIDETKAFIYIRKDNFSKACLHVPVAKKISTALQNNASIMIE